MSREIFVVAEHLKNEIANITFEMLAKGRELADALGGRLCALLVGHGVRNLAEPLGVADAVLYLEDERLAGFTPEAHQRALAAIIEERTPQLILIGHTSTGMDLAAALSVELRVPLIAYCSDLRVEERQIIVTSRLYGGKIIAEAQFSSGLVMVLPGAFPAEKGRTGKTAAVETLKPPPLEGLRTRFQRLIEPEAGDIDITKEEILVAVGRGIQGQENLSLAEGVAQTLGGALCASRPIIDQGWLPTTRLIGRSGMIVKPKLYLAAGISGAPEHLEGMKDAALIIAINADASAPIFEIADYGIVGDLLEILPQLTEEISKQKGTGGFETRPNSL